MRILPAVALFGLLALVPATAPAQVKWKEIGVTASNSHVSVDPRSVKRTGGIVSATIRAVFAAPVKTAQGMAASTQTRAMVDCAAHRLAASENAFFADARGTRAIKRTVNKVPGYSVVLEGTLGEIAVGYLCKK